MHRLGGVKECITADGRKAPVGAFLRLRSCLGWVVGWVGDPCSVRR